MRKSLTKIIFVLLFTMILNIFLVTVSKAERLGIEWDKDGDGKATDKDIALWTTDANWFSDSDRWNPNNLIGKTVGFYASKGGVTDRTATISQMGSFCVGHINSKIELRSYYTITNIIDVDTNSVFNKNVQSGNSGKAGRPGGVISYGYDNNNVKWTTSNEGASTAVKLAYLTSNSFARGEAVSRGNSTYKAAIQFTTVKSASTMVSGLGLNSRFSAVKPEAIDTAAMTRSQNYLNTVKSYSFEEQSTNTAPIVNNLGGRSYIGPYKISTQGGRIVSAQVVSTDGKNTTYAVEGFCDSIGGTAQSISDIPSGQEFYIVVNSSISTEVKVNITKNFEGYKSRMYFLYGGDYNQNLIAYRAESSTFANTINLRVAKPGFAKLEIIKRDVRNQCKTCRCRLQN